MKKIKFRLQIGDSVKVVKGTMDPDMEDLCIEGWQGRISEVTENDDDSTIGIQWDSITLNNMPAEVIVKNKEDGLDYSTMYLDVNDIEPAKERGTKKDVKKALKEIEEKYYWISFGDEGKRIHEVLLNIDSNDIMRVLETWEKHLVKHLTFPFDAEVSEYQERGPLQGRDKVSVKNISLVDDLYGIIVELRHGRKKYHFPLCDLEVIQKDSRNYQLVKDYCIWFANRY